MAIDLGSKKIFFIDLDDTLINTTQASELGLRRSYEKLASEWVTGFEALPSFENFEKEIKAIYRKGRVEKKVFDYDEYVFEAYCNQFDRTTMKLKHYEHSLAARLFYVFRQAKNHILMASPGAFQLLHLLNLKGTCFCVTEGRCNYQHTKAMLTDIEEHVELVVVAQDDKRVELDEFVKKFISQTGVRKEDMVMIGNSRRDIEAGKQAGIDTILISSGADAAESAPDLVLKDLIELASLVLRARKV